MDRNHRLVVRIRKWVELTALHELRVKSAAVELPLLRNLENFQVVTYVAGTKSRLLETILLIALRPQERHDAWAFYKIVKTQEMVDKMSLDTGAGGIGISDKSRQGIRGGF